MRRALVIAFVSVGAGCLGFNTCPSTAGGSCDPRNFNCPTGYTCALGAEVCTRACEQASDCWVKVSAGCRPDGLPGQRLPDGGVYVEQDEDGYCPDTRRMVCLEGACQREACLDGGCDYDPWGPSPFKGNREQGPAQ